MVDVLVGIQSIKERLSLYISVLCYQVCVLIGTSNVFLAEINAINEINSILQVRTWMKHSRVQGLDYDGMTVDRNLQENETKHAYKRF